MTIKPYQMNPVYWLHANPISFVWYHLKKLIAMAIRSFLKALSADYEVDPNVVDAIASTVLILVLVCLCVLVGWRIVVYMKKKRNRSVERTLFGHQVTGLQNAQYYLDLGKDYAEKLAFREAIRAEFVGLLLHIEAQVELHVEEYWTTKEIATALDLIYYADLNAFVEVTHLFNQWCYGPSPRVQDYQVWQQKLSALL